MMVIAPAICRSIIAAHGSPGAQAGLAAGPGRRDADHLVRDHRAGGGLQHRRAGHDRAPVRRCVLISGTKYWISGADQAARSSWSPGTRTRARACRGASTGKYVGATAGKDPCATACKDPAPPRAWTPRCRCSGGAQRRSRADHARHRGRAYPAGKAVHRVLRRRAGPGGRAGRRGRAGVPGPVRGAQIPSGSPPRPSATASPGTPWSGRPSTPGTGRCGRRRSARIRA